LATLAPSHPLARSRSGSRSVGRVRRIAGVAFLVGVFFSFLGFVWDVQWHSDVGPDTFFTLPHLVLYSGVALAGLSCLAVVLATTWRVRGGDPAAAEGTIPVLRGAFHGPAGFVIGGVGAAAFLLYGGLDQWWHGVYGFDVTLISPPHVGLILSLAVTMVGSLVAFAPAARREFDNRRPTAGLAPAVGFAAAAAILVAFVTPTVLDAVAMLWPFHGTVDSGGVVVALLYPTILMLVAAAVPRPGMATLTALAFALIRLLGWVLAPWLTEWYAGSLDLFLRDYISGVPVVPGLMPAYLLAAAVLVDGLLLAARRRRWDLRLVIPLAGAGAAVLLRLLEPVMATQVLGPEVTDQVRTMIEAERAAEALPTLIAVPVVGALAGWIGWRLGRAVGAANDSATQDRPRAAAAAAAPTPTPTWAD